jgi:hypothetical protein
MKDETFKVFDSLAQYTNPDKWYSCQTFIQVEMISEHLYIFQVES